MAAPGRKGTASGEGGDEPTNPQDFPRSNPPMSALDHSWVFQSTMEMQKSIGQILEAINALRADTKAHGEKLEKFERIFYAAGAVGTVLLTVVVFLINKLWDPVVAALLSYAKTRP